LEVDPSGEYDEQGVQRENAHSGKENTAANSFQAGGIPSDLTHIAN
jgi:hypothetical protein